MFCTIPFYFYQSKLGFCICSFNCQSCRCGQLSHNSIMRDLGNPNFWICSYITFQLNNRRCSHIQTKVAGLQSHTSRTCEFTYSYIFILIPQESRYWWRNIISWWDFYLEPSGVIWANMSLQSGSNAFSFI